MQWLKSYFFNTSVIKKQKTEIWTNTTDYRGQGYMIKALMTYNTNTNNNALIILG